MEHSDENKPIEIIEDGKRIGVGYIEPISFHDLNLDALSEIQKEDKKEMTPVQMFLDMCHRQLSVNETVATKQNVNWIEKTIEGKWDQLFAGVAELIEVVNDHEDWWKWWVKQESNLSNSNTWLELVDAFHFFMSHDIAWMAQSRGTSQLHILAEAYANVWAEAPIQASATSEELGTTCMNAMKIITVNAFQNNQFNASAFFTLCKQIGMDLNSFYTIYLGKSVLNKFRQANGYKEGTYHKKWWAGKEDNYYLLNWIMEYEGTPTEAEIEKWLEDTYRDVTSIN